MKKKVLIAAVVNLCILSKVWCWNDEVTHKDLTRSAANQSDLSPEREDVLSSIGFSVDLDEVLYWPSHVCDDKTGQVECTVRDWLRYGSEKEDARKYNLIYNASVRCFNHFHDPIGNKGLSDDAAGQSALEWAQDANNQFGEVEGDQSWSMVRTLFYQGLTGATETERNADLAAMFKGLGHQMHLVQDMGVPYHVRNDAHAEDGLIGRDYRQRFYFERWVKDNRRIVNNMADSAKFPNLKFDELYSEGTAPVPISQLWDADEYTDGQIPTDSLAQGLSEYTNGNFFSHDTIFAADRYSAGHKHYFPYPNMSSTNLPDYLSGNMLPEEIISEEGEIYSLLHIKKVNHGEEIDTFVSVGYFSDFLKDDWIPEDVLARSFYLDEQCHRAYAEKLVPRAVGYSAALLNYFFRGKMELMPEVSDQGDFLGYVIENKTEEEEMEGTFEIYYDNVDSDRIKIWSGDLNLGPKDSDTSKSAPFDLDHPDPAEAEEPGKYILAFRGKIGHEQDAVAGGISVLKASEYVYVEIGDRCLIWDIARNDYASITDAAGDDIGFPCETSQVSEWLDSHPITAGPSISWDYTPFGRAAISASVDSEGPNCEMRTDSQEVCAPTPGLPDKEDCDYRYISKETCSDQGPYQQCGNTSPETDSWVTWLKDDSYVERRGRSTYQAVVSESDHAIFGTYLGSFNSHEGMIRNTVNSQYYSLYTWHRINSHLCLNIWGPPYEEQKGEGWWYYHSEFKTFLGNLGEITTKNSSKQTTINGDIVYFDKIIEGIDTPTNKYKVGLVSEKSVVFIFLYQYRIRVEKRNDPDGPSSISYQGPHLLAQSAAKGYDDTSSINPFGVSRNSSFTNAIRVLVDDFYSANGAQGDEILQFDDQIKVNIRSQIID